jgi:ribosome biogenesis GTPase / thiamine phosphate phosphatase
LKQGLVIKSTGSWYHVRDDDNHIIPCKIKGTYRIRGIKATNPVAVGDFVTFHLAGDGTGMISDIKDRKNYIIRRATNLSREYQLIASNIDQALLMVSLVKPVTHLAFIDRFLVSAEAFRIPVIIIINKIDLYSAKEMKEMNRLVELYEGIGYHTLQISLKTKFNLEKLEKLLENCVTVVAGNSGVGKSTLLNHLDPMLNVRTGEISGHHKTGQHTTTFAEMYFLNSGTRIIDTPGIKGFGMVDIQKEELFHFFPEIFRISEKCRFHNCLHVNEPDCAVMRAVENREISSSRYLNYLGLLEDVGDKYRK